MPVNVLLPILIGFLILAVIGGSIEYMGREKGSVPIIILGGVFCILVLSAGIFLIGRTDKRIRNEYVYLVTLADDTQYTLTYENNEVKITSTGFFGTGSEKITFYTDDGVYVESNQFTCKRIKRDSYETISKN